MHLSEDTLDDLLHEVFQNLLQNGARVKASKGWNSELMGVSLEIKNPRARLSRTETKGTVFSCLGEVLWYLAGTDKLDFIKYYISGYDKFSDDGQHVYGAYGPRIFKMRGKVNQIENVIKLLKRKRSSRQAVIQIFNAEDIVRPHNDIPCTCTIQFFVRRDGLHMVTHMRSNDAFLGLPHDIFAFTLLQEIVARSLRIRLGSYRHLVGSLHLYDVDRKKAQRFLKEGWQSKILMPAMPTGDPWPNLDKLLKAELKIRQGQAVKVKDLGLPNYWGDLIRLLQVYSGKKNKNIIVGLKKQMFSDVYNPYIDKRIAAAS